MTHVFVVYPAELLTAEFGPILRGMTGICEVGLGMMTTSIIPTEDLAQTVGFSPSVPSVSGVPTLLDYETELEAYRRIRAEAESMSKLMRATLPVGYYKPAALWLGMFEVSLDVGLLKVRLGDGLATALGLREGDGLCMGVSPDNLTLAFCHDSDGAKLDTNLITSFPTGVSLPRELEVLGSGEWRNVAIEVRDHIVFVRIADLSSAFGLRRNNVEDDAQHRTLPTCSSQEAPTLSNRKLLSRALLWSVLWLNAITPVR
jgi:hypothetical protein